MKFQILISALFVSTCAFACSSPSGTPKELEAEFEDPAAPIEAIIETTPQMLQAALTEDPELMRAAAVAEAFNSCHVASTCPGYGSCGGWSALNICDETCGGSCGLANWTYQTQDSYRVCFNAAQQACTEWRRHSFRYCDC